jgi:hypothetical protein
MGCKCVPWAPWPVNTKPFEDEAPRIRAERRERIATACLTGIAAHPEFPGAYTHYADEAVRYADALIARLEAKP